MVFYNFNRVLSEKNLLLYFFNLYAGRVYAQITQLYR